MGENGTKSKNTKILIITILSMAENRRKHLEAKKFAMVEQQDYRYLVELLNHVLSVTKHTYILPLSSSSKCNQKKIEEYLP